MTTQARYRLILAGASFAVIFTGAALAIGHLLSTGVTP